MDPVLGRRHVPIGNTEIHDPTESEHFPAVSNTILDSLSAAELEQLLIFKTSGIRVYLDTQGPKQYRTQTYLRYSDSLKDSGPEGTLGSIQLPRSWDERDGHYVEIIIMGPVGSDFYLIETDQRGVSYRVLKCDVIGDKWLAAGPRVRTVYML
jgi:hypothetical protein